MNEIIEIIAFSVIVCTLAITFYILGYLDSSKKLSKKICEIIDEEIKKRIEK